MAMNLKYDTDWVEATLADLADFCDENALPNSREAIDAALSLLRAETKFLDERAQIEAEIVEFPRLAVGQ